MMKKYILVTLLLIISNMLHAQKVFNGQWEIFINDSEGINESSFCITLKQEGDIVSGEHIIVIDYGNYIDNYEDSINGFAKDSVAIINIRSGRCPLADDPIGKARIELTKDDKLKFKLLKAPKDCMHFFPDSIVMTRYIPKQQN